MNYKTGQKAAYWSVRLETIGLLPLLSFCCTLSPSKPPSVVKVDVHEEVMHELVTVKMLFFISLCGVGRCWQLGSLFIAGSCFSTFAFIKLKERSRWGTAHSQKILCLILLQTGSWLWLVVCFNCFLCPALLLRNSDHFDNRDNLLTPALRI